MIMIKIMIKNYNKNYNNNNHHQDAYDNNHGKNDNENNNYPHQAAYDHDNNHDKNNNDNNDNNNDKNNNDNNDNNNHQEAAYLRTQAALRARQYLQPPPSFAPTQGIIIMIIKHQKSQELENGSFRGLKPKQAPKLSPKSETRDDIINVDARDDDDDCNGPVSKCCLI